MIEDPAIAIALLIIGVGIQIARLRRAVLNHFRGDAK